MDGGGVTKKACEVQGEGHFFSTLRMGRARIFLLLSMGIPPALPPS